MRHFALGFALLFGFVFVPRAEASPLDLHRVPADAAGVGHIDLDAFRASSFMKPAFAAIDGITDDPGVAIARPFITQIEKSCSAITLWIADSKTPQGANADVHTNGVVILEFATPVAANDFTTMLVKKINAKKIDSTRYRGMVDSKPVDAVVLGNALALSDDAPSIDKTIAVSQGKAPSLTDKLLPAAMDRGMFMFVVLGKGLLDQVRQSAGSTLLQSEMSALSLNIGEVSGELRARARAVMASADGAQKIKAVIDGLLALVSLADDAKPFAPFAKNIKVTATGTTAELSFAMPTADVLKLVNAVGGNIKVN